MDTHGLSSLVIHSCTPAVLTKNLSSKLDISMLSYSQVTDYYFVVRLFLKVYLLLNLVVNVSFFDVRVKLPKFKGGVKKSMETGTKIILNFELTTTR